MRDNQDNTVEATAVANDTTTAPASQASVGAAVAMVASAALAACGGGGSDSPDASTSTAGGQSSGGRMASAQALLSSSSASRTDAWRFLTQATMGPTAKEVDYVTTYGINAWLSQQFAITTPKRNWVQAYRTYRNNGDIWNRFVTFAWWEMALSSDDLLRQRVVNALIEILVISMRDDTVGFRPILAAGYMDMLAQNAFGNFRQLIEGVCKSPAMGAYLSHLGNLPPDGNRRIPDQNFARELIQLFTLGLSLLNMDGTQALDANGRPQSTTKSTDIPVLSNVFTGWAVDDDPAKAVSSDDVVRWFGDLTADRESPRQVQPMKGYPAYHSTDEKVISQLGLSGTSVPFLGSTLHLSTPQQSLTDALNIIFQHQNLAPFISKQMIQRLVTSNPSPAYVQRVATAFKSSSWDMKTLIRAILTDTEARSATTAATPTFGKLREPLMRITHLLRAFGVNMAFVGDTNVVASPWVALNLNQGPIYAPSVFNFFSPTYRFVGGAMAQAGKVTPEMQIATEASVVAYMNAVYDIIANGLTQEWPGSRNGQLNISEEVAVAGTPSSVVASINRKLFGNTMSAGLITQVTAAATAAGTSATATERVQAAIFLAVMSPEYLVQK